MEATGMSYGKYTLGERKTADPNTARKMREVAGFAFTVDPDGDGVIAQSPDVRCRIRTFGDIWALREIFLDGQYRFNHPSDCIVMDIGGNIGLSSLSFAVDPKVRAIYAYEPFTPTYNDLIANLKMNPELASKITPNNYGIAKTNTELEVDYCPTFSSVASISGPLLDTGSRALIRESISLRKASEIVKGVISEHPTLDLIVKLDCEGSEYEIMEELDENELIPSVSAFLIEWHKKGAEPLIARLEKNRFHVLNLGKLGVDCNMLYAARIS